MKDLAPLEFSINNPGFFGVTTKRKTLFVQGYAPRNWEVLPGQHFQFTFGNRGIACRGGTYRSPPKVLHERRLFRPRWRNGERPLGLFRDFRRAADALERLAAGMSAAQRERLDTAPVFERLHELEQSRSLWEAEVEGILAKAEGKLKAAANSEARERTMRKSREADIDPFNIDSEEVEGGLPAEDAWLSHPQEVQPVRVDVAPDYKTLALSRKFG